MSDPQGPMALDAKKLLEYIHPLHLADYLNRVLTFLRSNDVEMCVPNITSYTEALLVKLASNPRRFACNKFNEENRKFLNEITEELEVNRDVYRWTHSIINRKYGKPLLVLKKVYTNKGKTQDRMTYRRLALEKRRKKYKQLIKDEVQRFKFESSFYGPDIKLNGQLASIVKEVSQEFIRITLHSLIQFVKDRSQASIYFEDLSDEEMCFVKYVKTMAASDQWYDLFEADSKELLQKLNLCILEVIDEYKIKMESGTKVVKGVDIRYIHLMKVPKDIVPSVKPRPVNSIPVPSKSNTKTVSKTRIVRDRSISNDRMIQFESGGKLSPSKEQSAESTEYTAERPHMDRLNKRKAKLLEDMSVPVESDKGIRMMLLMGWEGGGLGLRGEGITEPIIPAIELPPGAGLGHIPPPKGETGKCTKLGKVTPRKPAEFRLELLQNIHELLVNKEKAKDISFVEPLNRKEYRFMNSALRTFNHRGKLSLNIEPEVEKVALILEELLCDPFVELKADVSLDYRKLTLKKIKTSKPKVIKNPPENVAVTKKTQAIAQIKDDIEYIGYDMIQDAIPLVTVSYLNEKGKETHATKLLILIKIDEFVMDPFTEKKYEFDLTLKKNIKKFLEDIVFCVNERTFSPMISKEERPYLEHIFENIDKCKLVLEYPSSKSFSLKKTYYQKLVLNPKIVPRTINTYDNNNDIQTNDQNNVIGDKNKPDDLSGAEKDNQKMISYKAKTKTDADKCDVATNAINDSKEDVFEFDIEDILDQISPVKVKKEIKDDEVSISKDNNDVNINAVSVNGKVKEETDFDRLLEDECTKCDIKLDVSDLDNDIKELEDAMLEADFSFHSVKDELTDAGQSTKRSHTNSETSEIRVPKRSRKRNGKFLVSIKHQNNDNIEVETVKKLQKAIINEIEQSEPDEFLPLLNCHGIQDGGLVYGCHDDSDVKWLEILIGGASELDLKITKCVDDFCFKKVNQKLAIKINCFIKCDSKKMFSMIELYNNGLKTDNWKVLSEKAFDNYSLFIVEVDDNSSKYISDANFSLFFGIDKAIFSIIY